MARVLRNHWRCLLTVLVLATLAARVAWIASHTETGWQTISSDWREATTGQFVGHRLPVAQRDLGAQTEFWLAEIDRILARESHTPALLLGGLRMLGTYTGDYQLPLSVDLVNVPVLDIDGGPRYRGYDMAGPQRRARQLELAAQAAKEFPTSPSVWQTWAELSAQYFGTSEDPQNTDGWRKILEECRRHDPDNSLYAFLIASRLLSEARQIAAVDESAVASGNSPSNDILQLHQRQESELENAAIEQIKNGLTLPKFEWPNRRAHAAEFINRTSLPLAEKTHLIAWSENDNYLLSEVADQLVSVASRVESRAPGTDTKDLRRLVIAVCELDSRQLSTDPIRRWREARTRAYQWKQWSDFLERDLETPSEDAVTARKMAIDLEVHSRQWTDVISSWFRQTASPFNNTWIGYIAWKAAALAVQLFLIACIAIAVWQIFRIAISVYPGGVELRLGIFRQIAAWFAAFVASVVIFALAPTEIIGHVVQGWIAVLLFVVAIVGLPIGVAIALKGRISIWTLLAFTVGYTLLFFQLYFWNMTNFDRPLQQIPPAIWIPPRGVEGFSADQLENRVRQRNQILASKLNWAALQYVLYHGAEWTIAGALVGIGIWWWARANRERKRESKAAAAAETIRRNLLPGVFRAVARSALGAAAVALAVYLALAPERIERFEAIYRFESQQVQNANADWAGLQKRFDELMADEQGVATLRRQVEKEFNEPVEP